MAKTKLRAGFRPYRRGEKSIRNVRVTIVRDAEHFVACASIGTPGRKAEGSYHVRKGTSDCAVGRNPRLAVANILGKLAGSLKHRGEHGRGAFAGRRRRR